MQLTSQPYGKSRTTYLVLFIQRITIVVIAVATIMLSGCQSLIDSPITSNEHSGIEYKEIDYGQYYLLLSQFSVQQLADEIHQQKTPIANNTKSLNNSLTINWQLKSVLLYALPSSPVHNPFTAKSKLNQLSLGTLNVDQLTPANFAFFEMLKEQLNQQVLLLNKLALAKKSYAKIKQEYLQQQIDFQHLQQQIIQLKKLETNINEHGQ